MPKVALAHLRDDDQDMLLFPLGGDIASRGEGERLNILNELEWRAHQAGMAGWAAIFWRDGFESFFMGPPPRHAFLRGISIEWVEGRLNQELSW